MLAAQIPANILEMYQKYKHWVSVNPQLVGDIETSVKWLSYILVGKLPYSLSTSLCELNNEMK